MKHKIYIGGKISGLTPEQFHKNFDDAKRKVQGLNPDSEIVIPTDLCHDDWDWETCMGICLDALWDCDKLYVLPNWEGSKGTFIETKIANKLGIPVIYL